MNERKSPNVMPPKSDEVLVLSIHGTWARGFFPDQHPDTWVVRFVKRFFQSILFVQKLFERIGSIAFVSPNSTNSGESCIARGNDAAIQEEMPVPWFKSQSDFFVRVRERSSIPFHVVAFEWSGGNSFRARYDAAKKFADLVNRLAESHVGPIIVIAHSHGGNVFQSALPLLPEHVRQRLTTAVFLATPFLHFEPKLHRRINTVAGVSAFAFTGVVIVPAMYLLGTATISIAAYSVVTTAMYVRCVFFIRKRSEGYKEFHESQQKIARSFIPAIFVRTRGDEALSIFSIFESVGRVLDEIVDRVNIASEDLARQRRIAGGGERFLKTLAGAAVVFIFVSVFWAILKAWLYDLNLETTISESVSVAFSLVVGFAASGIIVVLKVLGCLFFLVAFALFLVGAVLVFRFGWDTLFAAWNKDIDAAGLSHAFEEHRDLSVELRSKPGVALNRVLSHSVYDDQECIDACALALKRCGVRTFGAQYAGNWSDADVR
jgi:hypothetical protein